MTNNISNSVMSLAERRLGEFKIRSGEVVPMYCPFCNGGPSNDIETFSIGLYNGLWNCLRGSCNKKGNFKDLCDWFGERCDVETVSFKPQLAASKKEYSKPDPEELHERTEDIDLYFAKRRIFTSTLDDFHISADSYGNIAFPFYRNHELIYVKYRKPNKYNGNEKVQKIENGKPVFDSEGNPVMEKNRKEWSMKNGEPILFGMDNVSFNKPLIITEGQIDALSLYEAGQTNVVSVPMGCNNFDWIELCYDWLEKFQQIILFGDNDEPGIEMTNTLMSRLGEDRCMMLPEYPELAYDGKDYGRLCKDANEILYCYGPEVLNDFVKQASPVPIKGVLNLASVPFIDPLTVPRIYTKIPTLDDMIGGLGEGSVTVISGKRGEGKSTISGTFLLNAIQMGYKVAAYSGELSAQKFLEWIFCQATESKYIDIKVDERSGKKYTVVPKDVQDRIREWLDNKFYLFDNAYIEEDSQQDAVLKVFNLCAKRYGCKLFLLDNMMSVLSSADEENKAQARFMAKLKAFAVKYKVAVLCVCHPRKIKTGDTFGNDDVSGSSALTNLADTVLSVEKPNIRVTKNRDFGTTGLIICNYDPVNRRIFQADRGDNLHYGWNHIDIKMPEHPANKETDFQIQYGTAYKGGSPF